ncbi:unnamed protein product [Boreogadus saida]
MINILRSEDRIKLAVRLESGWSERVRYMVVVYTNGRQDTEENILLGDGLHQQRQIEQFVTQRHRMLSFFF